MDTCKIKSFFSKTTCSIVLLSILATVLIVKVQSGANFDIPRITVHNYPVVYSMDEQLKKSQLIVKGKIVKQSEIFTVTPASGVEGSNFSDYYLQVSDVLRGEASKTDLVPIRIEGGDTKELSVVVECQPDIKIGDEVIALLYKPNMGGAYNTDEDYYRIVGMDQGLYFINNGDSKKTIAENHRGESVDFKELEKKMSAFTKKNPINYNWVYEEVMENVKKNLETGFISQEEYDSIIDEIGKYATVKK